MKAIVSLMAVLILAGATYGADGTNIEPGSRASESAVYRLSAAFVKRRILDSLFSPQPRSARAFQMLMSTRPNRTTPDAMNIIWSKTLLNPYPLYYRIRKSEPILLTPAEEATYSNLVREGEAFRLKFFTEVWEKSASPIRRDYDLLKALFEKRPTPDFERRHSALSRARAEQLGQAEFERIFGLPPTDETFAYLSQVPPSNPVNGLGQPSKTSIPKQPGSNANPHLSGPIFLDPSRELNRLVTRFEIFHEEPKRNDRKIMVYRPRSEVLRGIEGLLPKTQTPLPQLKTKLLTPTDPAYQERAIETFRKPLDEFVAAMKLELQKTTHYEKSMDELRKRFLTLNPPLYISDYDAGFGLGTSSLISSEFAKFVRAIKWWGLSQNLNYWARRDRTTFSNRLWTSRYSASGGYLMDSLQTMRLILFLSAKFVPPVLLGSYLLTQLGSLSVGLLTDRYTPSKPNKFITSLAKSKWFQKARETVLGKPDVETASRSSKDQKPGTRPSDSTEISSPDPDFKETTYENESDANSPGASNFKKPLYFIEKPETQERMDPGPIPFVDSSDRSEFGEFTGKETDRRVGFAFWIPQQSRDAEIQIRSVLPVRAKDGRVSIPTPVGHKLVGLQYGGQALSVYRNQAGNYFFTAPFAGAHTLVAQFKFEPAFVAETHEEPLIQTGIGNWDEAALYNAGFRVLSQSFESLASEKNNMTFEEVTETIANRSIYSRWKPMSSIRRSSHTNSYTAKFADNLVESEFVGKCDHGNKLACMFLRTSQLLGRGEGKVRVRWVAELIPERDGTLTTEGHSQTFVTDDKGRLLRILDATPRRQLPAEWGISNKQVERAQSPAPRKLVTLNELKEQKQKSPPRIEILRSSPLQHSPLHSTPGNPPIERDFTPYLQRFRRELVIFPPDGKEALKNELASIDLAKKEALATWRQGWMAQLKRHTFEIEEVFKSQKIKLQDGLPHKEYLQILYFLRDLLANKWDPARAQHLLGFEFTNPGQIDLAEKTVAALQKLESRFFELKKTIANPDQPSVHYRYYFAKRIEDLLFSKGSRLLSTLAGEIQAGLNPLKKDKGVSAPWNAELLNQIRQPMRSSDCTQVLRSL